MRDEVGADAVYRDVFDPEIGIAVEDAVALYAAARVVDEDVQAVKFSADFFCQCIYALAVGDVGGYGQDFATEGANFFGNGIELFGRACGEYEVGFFFGKGDGNGATNTPSTACDECDFSSEL